MYALERFTTLPHLQSLPEEDVLTQHTWLCFCAMTTLSSVILLELSFPKYWEASWAASPEIYLKIGLFCVWSLWIYNPSTAVPVIFSCIFLNNKKVSVVIPISHAALHASVHSSAGWHTSTQIFISSTYILTAKLFGYCSACTVSILTLKRSFFKTDIHTAQNSQVFRQNMVRNCCTK